MLAAVEALKFFFNFFIRTWRPHISMRGHKGLAL